ncbi:MAG: response regulator transcription factor [Sutterellaceae bacterium]|nr:response regulator transcription factor [Sutterellaceae bacterium]
MKFLLVDDHALIVQALSLLLRSKFPESSVLTGASAQDARDLVREHGEESDLLVLDLNLPGVETATSLLEELVKTNPALKILVLSGLIDQQNIMRVLQLGAAGFVPKSLDTDMLTNAIDFVLKGGVYIPTKLLSESQKAGLLTQAAVELAQKNTNEVHLTARQQDVLQTLARGLPIKRICRELNLSEGTVKTHVAAIYRAFGATNRTEALIAARRAGFDIAL